MKVRGGTTATVQFDIPGLAMELAKSAVFLLRHTSSVNFIEKAG